MNPAAAPRETNAYNLRRQYQPLVLVHPNRQTVTSPACSPTMACMFLHANRAHMTGYFQMIEGDDGAFMFTLRAGNHETVLTSRVFWSRQAAMEGVALLRKQSQSADCFVRHTDSDGRQWFEVLDEAHATLGRSEPYASRSGLAAGLASVKRNSASTVFRGLVRRASVSHLASHFRKPMATRPATYAELGWSDA